MPPTRARGDLRRKSSIRRLEFAHSGAYTIHEGIKSVVPWRNPDRLTPWPRSGRPSPKTHTTDTPTCPAWKSRRRCIGASIDDCGRGAERGRAAAAWVARQPARHVVVVALLSP